MMGIIAKGARVKDRNVYYPSDYPQTRVKKTKEKT